MSTVESLDLKNLHVIVMQEFQSEDIQELNSDFFRNLSSTIGKLKNEEYDGIEKKAKNEIISTTTNLIELLVNKRLEKISNSTKSNLVENDLGSKSKVSVSPTKFNSLSKNITLSKL